MLIRNTFIIIAVLIAAAVLTGCGGGSGGSSTATLSGTVLNGATNAPLAGVRVAIGTATAITDAQGAFMLSGVPLGTGTLTAQLTNYEIASQQVTIEAGANQLDQPVKMAPVSGNPPDVAPRTLEGTITLTGESNASGVTVSLLAGTTKIGSFLTTATGAYYFWAPSGTYTLQAAKTGFVTKTQQVAISDLTKVVTVNMTLTH